MTTATAPRFFETVDTRELSGFAVSIWDKTSGDMLAYRVAPTSQGATNLGIEILRALVASNEFHGVEVGFDVIPNPTY